MTTPRTPRYSLDYYAGVPRGLARSMLAIVNTGWTPEAWKAEQARLAREAARQKQKNEATARAVDAVADSL